MTLRSSSEIKKIKRMIAEKEATKARELAEMKCRGLGVGGPEPDESETDDGKTEDQAD